MRAKASGTHTAAAAAAGKVAALALVAAAPAPAAAVAASRVGSNMRMTVIVCLQGTNFVTWRALTDRAPTY